MAEYEFDANQEKVIKNVATRFIVIAVLLALGGIMGVLTELILLVNQQKEFAILLMAQASLQIIMGIFFFRPSDNFRRIVSTEGRDISELMIGLNDLTMGIKIIVLLVLGSVAFDIVLILLSL